MTRPRSTSPPGRRSWPRRQAAEDACPPRRAQPLPQGLQRGRLPPDHRRLPPLLEGAFRHFGGVPRRLVLDNLKPAVKKADWFDPEINPKVRSFGEHYGTVFLPTPPYTPRHKGKVERGVDYVQENALRGRSFPGLEEQDRSLRD